MHDLNEKYNTWSVYNFISIFLFLWLTSLDIEDQDIHSYLIPGLYYANLTIKYIIGNFSRKNIPILIIEVGDDNTNNS